MLLRAPVFRIAAWSLKLMPVSAMTAGMLLAVSYAPHSWIAQTEPFGSFPSLKFFLANFPAALVILGLSFFSIALGLVLWSFIFSPWINSFSQEALLRRIYPQKSPFCIHGTWLLRRTSWNYF